MYLSLFAIPRSANSTPRADNHHKYSHLGPIANAVLIPISSDTATELRAIAIFKMTTWSFLNPPSNISLSQGRLKFTTLPNTDYWHPPDRIAANGHFYYTKLALPREYGLHLQSTFMGDWKVTYDQAGVMIRASKEKWIKAGIEYVDGIAYLSSVVANPLSDWAIQPCPVSGPLTIRLTASPGPHAKVHISYRHGNKWVVFREITGWVFDNSIDIGVMACSPGQSSVDVEFWDVVAQDYSELAVEGGIEGGTLNPTFHFGGTDKVGNW